jgi:hypothetical protein
MKFARISLLLTILLFCIKNIEGQVSFEGIYIQEFKLSSGERNSFTEDITAQYRILLSNKLENKKIVNRANPAILEGLKENEIVILEDETGKVVIPQAVREKLQDIGVSITVEGLISYVPHKSLYIIRVKYSNIFTKEEIYENEVVIKSQKIEDRQHLKKQFITIMPEQNQSDRQLLISDDFLDKEKNPWNLFYNLYFEDFTSYSHPDFQAHIWSLNNRDDYWSGVKDGKYCFDIKKPNYSRHKYIQSHQLNYNTEVQTMPYSLIVELPKDTTGFSKQKTSGRGLTVRYDKKKKSCYAYTLTNEGDLKFIKVNYIFRPSESVILHSQRINIQPGNRIKLGIVCVDDKFYLFLNDKHIKTIKDGTFPIGLYGVFAHGEGMHCIDDVTVYEPFYNGK